MKYLVCMVLLLALCACEKISSELKDDGGALLDDSSKPLKGHIARAGLYRLVRSGGVIDDPSTSTGKSVLKPVIELVRTTDRIPLIKSGQIYLQYRIWPLPDQTAYAELRRVLKHPEMTLPDGKVSTGSDYMIKTRVSANQAIGFTGYGFDEDYELVEGEWVFQVWYKDKKMIDQKFTTYWPDKEELAKLEPILELGNKALGQNESNKKPVTKRDWPTITIGGIKSSEKTISPETQPSQEAGSSEDSTRN